MKRSAPVLGRFEYSTLLVGTLIGGSLYVWPLHLVMTAGRESTSAVLLAGTAGTLYMLLQAIAWSPDEHASILEWSLTLMAAILTLLIDAVITALFVEMMKEFFFARTPRIALVAPVLGLTAWWSTGSWKGVARRTQLWIPLILLGSLIAVGASFHNWVHPMALEPRTWTALQPAMQGTVVLAYLLVPLGATTRVVGRRLAASARDRVRSALAAAAIFWVWLMLLYTTTVGSLGTDAVVHLRWPLVYVFEETTVDSSFLVSRLGILAIFEWTALVVIAILIHFKMAVTLAEDLTARWTTVRLVVVGLGLSVLVAGIFLFDTENRATHLLLTDLNPVVMGLIALEGLTALTRWAFRRLRNPPHPEVRDVET